MAQKETIFKKIYFIEDTEKLNLDDSVFDMFLMDSKPILGGCYFTKLSNKAKKAVNFDELDNVKFIEFDDTEELGAYINKRGRYEVIDWSVNFEKPCVLDYV